MRLFTWLVDMMMRPACWLAGHHQYMAEGEYRACMKCAICGKRVF